MLLCVCVCVFNGNKEEKNNEDIIIMVGVKELRGSVWWTLLRKKNVSVCVLWARLVLIYLQGKLLYSEDVMIRSCYVF